MNLLHGIISLFGRRKSGQATKTLQTRETLPPTNEERIRKRLAEQNWLRFFAFYCIHVPHLPFPVELDDTSDAILVASVHAYFERRFNEYKAQSERSSPDFDLALFASGLLACGRVEMVEVILDNLTRESFITDHGAGRCNLLPMMAIKLVLPIGDTLCACSTSAGKIDIAATREWFHANRERLEWNDETSRFVTRNAD